MDRATSVCTRDGCPAEHRRTNGLGLIAWGTVALAGALLVGGSVLARGQDSPIWFELHAAYLPPADLRLVIQPDPELPLTAFQFQSKTGPFPELSICYAFGALGINALNPLHPSRAFMGRCDGGPLLTLRELSDRAMALLPKDGGR